MAIQGVTITKNWRNDVKVGLYYSAALILINLLIPSLTIGLPVRLTSFSDDFLIAGVAAPLVEEVFFRFFVANFMLALGLPFLVILIADGVMFSLFHFAAYGSSLAAQSANFVGAFLFGALMSYIALKRRTFLTQIIIHSAFNIWLLTRIYF